MYSIFEQDIPSDVRDLISDYFKRILDDLYSIKEAKKTDRLIVSRYGDKVRRHLDIIKEEIYDKVLDYIMKKSLKIYKEEGYEKVLEFLKSVDSKKYFYLFIKRFLSVIIKNLGFDFFVLAGEDESYAEALERIYYLNSEVQETDYYDTKDGEEESVNEGEVSKVVDVKETDNIIDYYYNQIRNICKNKIDSYYQIVSNSNDFTFSISFSEVSGMSFSDRISYILDKYDDFVFRKLTSFDEYILKIKSLLNLAYNIEMYNIYLTTKVKKVRKMGVKNISGDVYENFSKSSSDVILLINMYLDAASNVYNSQSNDNIRIMILQLIYFLVATDSYLIFNNVNVFLNDFIRYSLTHGCLDNKSKSIKKPPFFIVELSEGECKVVDFSISLSILTTIMTKFRAFLRYSLKNKDVADNIDIDYKMRDKSDYKKMFENMLLFYIYNNMDILKDKTGAKHYNSQETVRNSYNLTYKSTIFEILRRYKSNNKSNVFYFIDNRVINSPPVLDFRKIKVKKQNNSKKGRTKYTSAKRGKAALSVSS